MKATRKNLLEITAAAVVLFGVSAVMPQAHGQVLNAFFSYDGNALPSAAGWTLRNYPAYEQEATTLNGGSLRIADLSTAPGTALSYSRLWDNTDGLAVVSELKMSVAMSTGPYGVYFATSDGANHMAYQLFADRIIPTFNNGSIYGIQLAPIYTDLTSMRTYRAEIDNGMARLYLDHVLVFEHEAAIGVYNVIGIAFGASSSAAMGDFTIDHISCYETDYGNSNAGTGTGTNGTGNTTNDGSEDGTPDGSNSGNPDGNTTEPTPDPAQDPEPVPEEVPEGDPNTGNTGTPSSEDPSPAPAPEPDEDPVSGGGTSKDGRADGITIDIPGLVDDREPEIETTTDTEITEPIPSEEEPEVIEKIQVVVDLHPFALSDAYAPATITALIEVPEGYSVCDLDPASILLDDLIVASTPFRPYRGEKENFADEAEGAQVNSDPRKGGKGSSEAEGTLPGCMSRMAMVEFDAAPFMESLGLGGKIGLLEIFVSGSFKDGTPFEGSDMIVFTVIND